MSTAISANNIRKKQLNLFAVLTGLLMAWLLLGIAPAQAQFHNGLQMTFGKNRVQWEGRFWSFFRFDKFDAYFYQNGQELAVFTAQYADKCLAEIEKKLDYQLDGKIQFVIFNKLGDLKQSNIGLINDAEYNVGGITHIVGSKVFLYYSGTYIDLQRQIRAGIANVLIEQMMFGGRITANIKNSALLSLPEWYSKGLISYISEPWSTEMDNLVKDGIQRGNYKKFSSLEGMEAVYAGHSMWRFIAEKYGAATVANIVYMTKVSKNVESGFLFVLGISFKTLVAEWMEYYELQYGSGNKTGEDADDAKRLLKPKKNMVYSHLRISPDGTSAVYVMNRVGKWKVRLYDFAKERSRTILRGGQKLDEKTDYSFPLPEWHPGGGLLSVIFESKGKNLLYFYNLEDRKFEKQRLFNIEKVLDYSFAPNGRSMVMSAVTAGQSDIYVYNLAAHAYESVTKDIWDDLDPCFFNNSGGIIFSSNRPDDSLRYDIPTNLLKARDTISEVPGTLDLFIYNYADRSPLLRRVTQTPECSEYQPMEYDSRHFAYLSDENGVVNRYIGRVDSAIAFIDTLTHYRYYTVSHALTDYSRNITGHHVSDRANRISEIIYRNMRYHMYVSDMPPAGQLKHKTLIKTYNMDKHLRDIELQKADTVESTLTPQEIEYIQQKKSKQRTRRMSNVLVNEMSYGTDTARVDINNYRFGIPVADNAADSGKTSAAPPRFTIPRQENYNVEYFINNLVTQLDFNFLNTGYQTYTGNRSPIFLSPGFNANFKLGVIDLMEDFRITGGFRISFDLDNNEFFIAFDNLKRRLDRTLVFHRQAMQDLTEYSLVKIRTHDVNYMIKWPFSNIMALKGTGILRWDRTIYAGTDLENLKEPSTDEYWAGLRAELIFDNTRSRGINIMYGARWKIFGEYYQKIHDEFYNLIVVGADFRHYQKLHKTFIWANRIAGSTSLGNSPLVYYLGGVDQWLLPKFNTDITVNPSKNYAFQTLATNMRGFNQNIRNGNNFLVVNSELRFPLFRYFSRKPLKSEFFNNFQVVAFGDAGMAWTNWDPWSDENTIFKEIYQQGPITVTILNKRDPVVMGIGGGLRSRILGYFIGVDYAWGIENMKFQKPIIYLSLATGF